MNLKSLIGAVVAVIPCVVLGQTTSASIAELKKAVEERHDVVEERFAEAFRLMNAYHSDIMADTGACYFSQNSEEELGLYPGIAYSSAVYDKLVAPVYELNVSEDDYDVDPPIEYYYYQISSTNSDLTAQNRKNAEDQKAASIEAAQAVLDAENDKEYDPTTRQYWKPGVSDKYDYAKYQKEYWTWWASARKTALETGVKVANFSKTIEDYKTQFPEHPELVDHNQKDLEAWTQDHERAVARAQRAYDLASSAQVVGLEPNTPANSSNAEAWTTWRQNRAQWYKDQQIAASNDYVRKTKDYLAGIVSHVNSPAYRRAVEKAEYLHNLSEYGFFPCGATFTKAEIKWKHPQPTNMEEQIEMLNQISQEVALLSRMYVSLSDVSRFDSASGFDAVTYVGRANEECGLVNRQNYREKIVTLWRLLHSMEAIPWPMLRKSYALDHEVEGGEIAAGNMNLSVGERASSESAIKNDCTLDLLDHTSGQSYEGYFDGLWNPYGAINIACGNSWYLSGSWGYVNAEPNSRFPYIWGSQAYSCYAGDAVSGATLLIGARTTAGAQYQYPAATVPSVDGEISVNDYGQPNSGSFVGDGEVKFTIVGDPNDDDVDDSTEGKTAEEIRQIANKLRAAYRLNAERTYKNADSYKRLGLPETLDLPVQVSRLEEEGENIYKMELTLPVTEILSSSLLDDSFSSQRGSYWLSGETVLYAKPTFSTMTEAPKEVLGAIHAPEVTIDSLRGVSKGLFGLQFPLSLRRSGEDCPILSINLLTNDYRLAPSYSGFSNLGFARALAIDGGAPEMTVKHDYSPLPVSNYLEASDAGTSLGPGQVGFFEFAAACGNLGRVVEIDFEDGKLEIQWQSYTHLICRYFLKGDGGYVAQPFRTYEVEVQGAANQLVDELSWGGAKYPAGYETVMISKDGKPWAKTILVGDDSVVEAADDKERLRVEYLDDSGNAEVVKRVAYWLDEAETVLKDGAKVHTLLGEVLGDRANNRVGYRYLAEFGNHQVTEERREIPGIPEERQAGDWPLGERWPDGGGWTDRFSHSSQIYDNRKWNHLAQTKDTSLEVIPYIWFPTRFTLSGEQWGRDGEFSEFTANGTTSLRSFKIADMAAISSATVAGNTVTSTLNVGGMQLATASSVFDDNLKKVTHNLGGVSTTIEYDDGGEVPWAVKKISSPTSTTEYAYSRTAEGLKVVETATTVGGGPVTVTESVTNDHGGFVSMARKLNGVLVAQATTTGHAPGTLWQPKDVTIFSNGVTRTQHLEYFADGTLKSYNNGNGRTDTFEWDVLGRIKSGSKLDGYNLAPDYDGLTTKFSLGGEQTESKTSIYGELEDFSSTAGAGVNVERTGTDSTGAASYTGEVTAEGRGAGTEFLADGLLKTVGGGLGTPGSSYAYSVQNVNGTPCIAVEESMLNGSGQETANVSTRYFDGYGRLIRAREPHPMGGGNYVDTDYSYDVTNRKVTITPPAPSKPITVAYNSNWLKSTISQGGHSVDIETAITGATVTQTVKDGARELFATETMGATGKVTSSINGKNPVSVTPSGDGNQMNVSGPSGLNLAMNYNKFGFESASGSVAGKSINGSLLRDGLGNVSQLSFKPPGAGGTVSMDIDKAGRVMSIASAGQNQNIAYAYANGGKQVTATGTPSRGDFSIEEDADGHPRKVARAGRDALQVGGDIRNGSVTYSLIGGTSGQTVTEYYSSGMYPLGRTRSDGSGYSLTYHPNGTVASLRNFDGASLGGGFYDFSFTTDPALGYPTGFSSSQSSLAMVPNSDGTTASVVYNSTDFKGQAQSYSCSYPSYYDGEPLQEVFGGMLAGYKINRVFDPVTGKAQKVELLQGNQVVHAVEYTPDSFGQLHGITTSGANSFSAVYARPSDYVRTLTAGPVATTRTLAADGSARLTSVSTQVPAGTYSATFNHVGQNRSGLSLTAPGSASAVWSYTFADQEHQLGQLQSATVVRGGASGTTLNYQHNASGVRSGTTLISPNHYTVTRVAGSRTVTVAGLAAPGASVKIELQGAGVATVIAAADGSFSRTLPAPAGVNGELPVKVTGTLAGAGDNGSDAVMRKDLTVALAPSAFSAVYGAHGALVSDWRWLYHWDSEGRLAGLESTAGSGSNLRIKFAYDNKNRRILKKVEHLSTDGSAVTRTVTTKFIYDGWRLLGEAIDDSTQASYLRTYTWGLDAFDRSGDENVVGALVAIHSKGQTYLPVHDGNGNILALVDTAGKEAASWERGPFGEVLQSSGNTDLCPFGFATAYTDAETGLAYFGHRFYSPALGSWLSREPLGELESFNLYSYCHNDPVNHVDRLGLDEVIVNEGVASYHFIEEVNGARGGWLKKLMDHVFFAKFDGSERKFAGSVKLGALSGEDVIFPGGASIPLSDLQTMADGRSMGHLQRSEQMRLLTGDLNSWIARNEGAGASKLVGAVDKIISAPFQALAGPDALTIVGGIADKHDGFSFGMDLGSRNYARGIHLGSEIDDGIQVAGMVMILNPRNASTFVRGARAMEIEAARTLYTYQSIANSPFRGTIFRTGAAQGRLWATSYAPGAWAFEGGVGNSLVRAWRTGRWKPFGSVQEISGAAADQFQRVRAFGPFRGWKRLAGQYYTTTPGDLDIASGLFLPADGRQVFFRYWDSVASHGTDALFWGSASSLIWAPEIDESE